MFDAMSAGLSKRLHRAFTIYHNVMYKTGALYYICDSFTEMARYMYVYTVSYTALTADLPASGKLIAHALRRV